MGFNIASAAYNMRVQFFMKQYRQHINGLKLSLMSMQFMYAGMPEPRVKRVQLHPLSFLFVMLWVHHGCTLHNVKKYYKHVSHVNHCRLMINGWLIKRLNGAILSVSCNSLYIKYNKYNNTEIAAIHKERIDDINVKKLTADFISRSSQRKHYF